jgi:uncharacterized protein (TIGR00369 family)
MKFQEYGEGKATLAMTVTRKFYNPLGTIHGGVITDLADASMGSALSSTLEENESFTTLELKMNFLRPAYEGKLTAESQVVHRARTISLVESVVKNGKGKVVARGIATQMILRPEKDGHSKNPRRGNRAD